MFRAHVSRFNAFGPDSVSIYPTHSNRYDFEEIVLQRNGEDLWVEGKQLGKGEKCWKLRIFFWRGFWIVPFEQSLFCNEGVFKEVCIIRDDSRCQPLYWDHSRFVEVMESYQADEEKALVKTDVLGVFISRRNTYCHGVFGPLMLILGMGLILYSHRKPHQCIEI